MAKSPLQLKYSAFFQIKLSPIIETADSDREPQAKIVPRLSVKPPGEGSDIWQVMLNVEIGPEEDCYYPYTGEFGIIGAFTIDKQYFASKSELEIKKVVGVNGASVLYGSIREHFSILSSRSVNGGVPPLSTLDFRFYGATKRAPEESGGEPRGGEQPSGKDENG